MITENIGKVDTETYDAANGAVSMPGQKQHEKTLKEVFEKELSDIYSAELQLAAALSEFAKAAYHEELEQFLLGHAEDARKQAQRLDKLFSRLNLNKTNEGCVVIEALIKETKKVISEHKESPVRDAILLISVQKAKHHEIASYGSLTELADVLGYHKAADLFEKTLEEEKELDEELSELAADINDEAAV